ncbi:hypothetical protein ACQKNB_02275 [Lysinibacillus xylanilyticus]|uniref:hypothetical protein n=1 Tax=Lysinibacillus xylanilyticus TaxID=582475 RepID=UPI003D08AF5F
MVDWSGDWATPWGSQRHRRDPGASNASEAAYRTPPGSFALCESEATATKRPVGTEINHLFCRRAILYYIVTAVFIDNRQLVC